jgi:hypothetical protein
LPPHAQDEDDLQAIYDVDGAIRNYHRGRPTTIDSRPGMGLQLDESSIRESLPPYMK